MSGAYNGSHNMARGAACLPGICTQWTQSVPKNLTLPIRRFHKAIECSPYGCRNDTAARRLYRRALDAIPLDPPLQGPELTQPVKLLFKWAHQEFKRDNLFQVCVRM